MYYPKHKLIRIALKGENDLFDSSGGIEMISVVFTL